MRRIKLCVVMAIAVIFTAVCCPAVFSADGETDALPENVLIRVGGKSVTDDIGGIRSAPDTATIC